MAKTSGKAKLGKGRHASAMKRQRQNIKRRERNKPLRATLRAAVKKARVAPSAQQLQLTIPVLDKMVTKGIIPRKRASRLASRLTKAMHKANKKAA